MTAPEDFDSRSSDRRLIAPPWHTVMLIAIFVALSVIGGFFQHSAKQRPATSPNTNLVSGYVSVLISEWLLVLYVRMGVEKRGMRLRDLIGGRWTSPRDVVKDIALATALWALWTFLQSPHVLGSGTNAAQGLLPKGNLESLVWIPLALSAGFCEELVFRGYLQRQFRAITGSVRLAVLFQAIVFGVGHLYEGLFPVALIILYGVLYGLLAAWRKSLRPGMMAHAWSDIFGVIIFRGM
jgi:membrane protease YdiL (CAAX protease family)